MNLLKRFLPAILAGLLMLPVALTAETGKYRLMWRDDPATTMVIGWCHEGGADDAQVYWGPDDHGTSFSKYPYGVPPHEKTRFRDKNGMIDSRFVRLTNLVPDSAYYFVIKDKDGVSERMWFKTAPDAPAAFSVVAGGDTRNNREPRQQGMRTIAKLRPLFVMHGGDYTDRDTIAQWVAFLDDWQLTQGTDGRMFPLIAARGNHERSNEPVVKIFDVPTEDVWYGLSVAGDMLRVITLNSMAPASPRSEQTRWLENYFKANQQAMWKIAQYHHPMRPHTDGKKENDTLYEGWAPLFFQYGLDVAVECDSHTVKRTWPLRPSDEPGSEMGFIRDDERGTVFVGEGCWGAPLRPNNDDKSWTRDSGSFNQIQWIRFYYDKAAVCSIMIDQTTGTESVDDSNPMELPPGIVTWKPANGPGVIFDKGKKTPPVAVDN